MTGLTGREVLVDAKRLCCPSHGEHLRAQWPKGYPVLAVKLFQAATENPELQKACGWTDEQDAVPERINDVTAVKPLCYFVDDDDTLRRLFREAGILSVLRCDLCGLTGDAGPYSMLLTAREVETRTVCLECMILAGRRCHAAHPDGGVW